MHWSDKYPHEIWTNVLVFDGKYLDYKIGNTKRDTLTWTHKWNNEILNNLDKLDVIHAVVVAHDDESHEKAFEIGEDLVENYIKNNGKYEF